MAGQSPFRFVDLPPELRNEIYYFALGERQTSSEPYGPTTCSALAPPALTRTNRQIRNEILGLYYSQNRFSFQLPFPGGQDGFEHWCAVMGRHFRHIKKSISFTHSDNKNIGPWRYPAMTFSTKIGFELSSDRAEDDPRRVGDGTLDVHSSYDITFACVRLMLGQAGPLFCMVGRKAAFDDVVMALCTVAPLCTQLSSRIYMAWSLPSFMQLDWHNAERRRMPPFGSNQVVNRPLCSRNLPKLLV